MDYRWPSSITCEVPRLRSGLNNKKLGDESQSLKSECKSIYKWIKIKIQNFIRLIKVLSAHYQLIIRHKKSVDRNRFHQRHQYSSTYSCSVSLYQHHPRPSSLSAALSSYATPWSMECCWSRNRHALKYKTSYSSRKRCSHPLHFHQPTFSRHT